MQLSGKSVQLNIGFESAYGVPILTTGYKVQYAPTLQANTSQAINSSTVINGSASPTEPFLGFKDGQVSFVVPVESKAFPLYLMGLFDVPTTTADTPVAGINSHVFKIGLTRKTLFCEQIHGDFSGGLVYTTTGIALESMSLSLGGDGELLATFSGIAKDTAKTTASAITTVNDYTDGYRFGQFQADITGTTAKFKTFDLTCASNTTTDGYIIDGTGTRSSAVTGVYGVSGSFTALFENGDLYADSQNFTTKQFTATLTNGEVDDTLRSIEFDMEETKLDAMSNGTVDSPSALDMSFNYQAFDKTGTNNSALAITVINDVASYA